MVRLLPEQEYVKGLPRKRAAAGVLFFNGKKELLLVKPVYVDHWKVVGGTVDAYESPLATCVRETKEELGLRVEPPRFLGVAYKRERAKNDENLIFYFFQRLSDEQIASIAFPKEELSEYRFFHLGEAMKVVSDGSRQSFPLCFAAVESGRAFYMDRKGSVG
ncbi:MAG: NUDIX hydrolase [Candidatus Kerfeldbacteria bacterium]|nr:NUDIX hydrolase [Candidatus Kerfeldbacteria bacterium]